MRPLRFVLMTTFYPPYHFGGDATCARALAHALARRGHAVHVIHDRDAYRALRPGEPDPPAELEPPGVIVRGLESPFPRLSALATQQSGRPLVHGAAIRRWLAEIEPDVIHYHNPSLVGGPGVFAYGDAVKLYTAHEHWLVCPTHVLWRHGRELCDARECLRCVLHYRRPPQLWRRTGWLERCARHVDVFLSPSRFSADKHREFGFPREMEVLPHFAPDGGAAPDAADVSASDGRPYFLFVGRLERIKGLQDVIPHFGDDAPADLWIAGSGDYEPELRRLAGSSRRVRFLGQLPHAKLGALYAGARAVVAPSICYEVFPMVLLEAFREGTPVVARRLGPYPEIVEQSGAGRLFETADELGAALRELAADAALRDRLGAAARQALRERWSEEAVIGRYLGIIGRVARESGRDETARVLASAGTSVEAGDGR